MNYQKELLVLQLKGYELVNRKYAGGIRQAWFRKEGNDFYENTILFDATLFETSNEEYNVENSINELKLWILRNSN